MLLAALVLGPLLTGSVRSQDFSFIQFLIGGGVILWVARIWMDRGHRLLWVPMCWVVLLFAGYAIYQLTGADVPMLARRELGRVMAYGAVFFLVLNLVRTEDRWRGMIYTLSGLGVLLSFYAIFQFATGHNQVWMFVRPEGYAGRGSGTYICPNHLAGFLAMVVPMTAALVLGGRTSIVTKVVLGYCVVMMLAGLGVSISRGGWIAAGAGLFTLVLIHAWLGHRSWRAWLFLVAAVGLLVVLLGQSMTIRKRAEKLTTGLVFGNSLEVRLGMWKAALEMWEDNVWLGVGPGHYDYRFPQYRPAIVQQRPGYAHNDYLNTLADWGAVGGALVLAGVGLTLGGAALTMRRSVARRSGESLARSDRMALLGGAVAGLVAIGVHSLFDFNMQVPANAMLAVVLLALVNSHQRFSSGQVWVRPGVLGRLAVTVVSLGAVGWLVLEAGVALRAGLYLGVAAGQKQQTPERIEALAKAAEADPANAETAYELGEAFRQLSFQGNDDYESLARQAIGWFERSREANPLDAYARVRIGMCLDWLGEHDVALPHYEEALELDPLNHHLCILQGWHYFQEGNYLMASRWFRRSLQIRHWPNPIGGKYFQRAERLLKLQQQGEAKEAAGN